MSHHFGKKFLVPRVVVLDGQSLDSSLDFGDEVYHIIQTKHRVVEEEECKPVNPRVDQSLHIFDQRLAICSNPADIRHG